MNVNPLSEVAPAFIEMAHQIVWASVATVGRNGRPRSRILHPIWQWDGEQIIGWIATGQTPVKTAHLKQNPYISVNYWTPEQDTCAAECRAAWANDDETRQIVWDLFENGPKPVGYNPRIVPAWTSPTADAFALLRLEPWRLRVFPRSVGLGQGGKVLNWKA